MTVFIAADHGGYYLKKSIKTHIQAIDVNPDFVPGDDYPLVAKELCRKVAGTNNFGVLICTSGIGMSIAANKVAGIRAALCRTINDALRARHDNDANVICLGAADTSARDAVHLVKAFINTDFLGRTTSGERHLRRREQLE